MREVLTLLTNDRYTRQAAVAYNCHFYYEWSRNFHNKLPCELRDIIYKYVIDDEAYDDVTYVYSNYYKRKIGREIMIRVLPPEAKKPPVDPIQERLEAWFTRHHFNQVLDVERAGYQTVQELIEAHVSKMKFQLIGGPDQRWDDPLDVEILVPAFLSARPFGVAVDFFANITRLKLNFQIDPLAKQPVINKACLEPLRNLRCKNAIKIVIWKFFATHHAKNLFRLMDDLSEWYFGMIEEGFEIPIRLKMRKNGTSLKLDPLWGEYIEGYAEWRMTWPKNYKRLRIARKFFEELLWEQKTGLEKTRKKTAHGESKFWNKAP
ncbi:hypothetical protein DM02DRAFT_612795 [Periconia macrospinosa]|uniref:Uncharacterized protein n=1 Tax=Periconia macrospinosa TaxID=97972 RepID=A0A2V1DXD2_9PLEO|nr:hypothetical protein DM02DRAFT_612795 [Periconia macrospinosa]